MMKIKPFQFLFFALFVKPLVWILIGLEIRNRPNLPTSGPAVLIANHNSHLDTLVIMALFPLTKLHKIRPAAAADYWYANRWIGWFAKNVIGVVPVERKGKRENHPLQACFDALADDNILIFFPEGTRGKPERLGKIKVGIAILAQRYPQIPVVPIYLYGLGVALPRGSAVFVPVQCDVLVGQALYWQSTTTEFMTRIRFRMQQLAGQSQTLRGG